MPGWCSTYVESMYDMKRVDIEQCKHLCEAANKCRSFMYTVFRRAHVIPCHLMTSTCSGDLEEDQFLYHIYYTKTTDSLKRGEYLQHCLYHLIVVGAMR